jgi:hypothetical protein
MQSMCSMHSMHSKSSSADKVSAESVYSGAVVTKVPRNHQFSVSPE